jgi:hypothetical protein
MFNGEVFMVHRDDDGILNLGGLNLDRADKDLLTV